MNEFHKKPHHPTRAKDHAQRDDFSDKLCAVVFAIQHLQIVRPHICRLTFAVISVAISAAVSALSKWPPPRSISRADLGWSRQCQLKWEFSRPCWIPVQATPDIAALDIWIKIYDSTNWCQRCNWHRTKTSWLDQNLLIWCQQCNLYQTWHLVGSKFITSLEQL